MSKKHTWSKTYPLSADKLMAIMSSEEFELGNIKAQPSNKDGKYIVVSKDLKKLVYRLDVVEWGKTMTGGIDKSKTENAFTTVTWDLGTRISTWVYKGAQERAKVWGSVHITPQGEQCRVETEFDVEISIPLLGGQIEKLVIAGVEKYYPSFVALVDEFVQKQK